MTNESDPLLGETEGIEGELLLIGNRTLLSLNLSSTKKYEQNFDNYFKFSFRK